MLGTLALWLLYLLGARLFNRAVGLLAAAIEAVAFLPVFYAHLALNDVPTLAPLTLSLLGTAGVLRHGRARDHALAGVGLGLACASKYTAGIVLVPYLVAAGDAREPPRRRRRRAPTDPGAAARPPLMAGLAAALGGVPGREPLRAARLLAASTANWSTSRASPPKRQGKLGAPRARRPAATTCGR